MKYSRKEIDKTGKIMLTATDQEILKLAIEKINDWRSLHLVPLDMLQQKIVHEPSHIECVGSGRLRNI